MKTKKLSKKLELNKKTVASLSTNDMANLIGGAQSLDPELCWYHTLNCTDWCNATFVLWCQTNNCTDPC